MIMDQIDELITKGKSFLEEGKLQIQGSLDQLRLQSGKHLEFLLPFAQLTETYPGK